MAKFEEKDPRWIVEERTDGTNVKNWHWTEKDCTSWSKGRLSELLTDLELTEVADDHHLKATGLLEMKGEAFINNRKNKLFASFDLVLNISYDGGVIEVPNFSDEQDPEDWDFRIIPDQETSVSYQIKDLIHRKGVTRLRSALSKYVEELKAGVPVNKSKEETSLGGEDGSQPKTLDSTSTWTSTKKASSANGFHSLHLEERFQATPEDIFDCFTIEAKLQTFTRSPAKIDLKKEGGFSWMDGVISGIFVEIEAPSKLVSRWRFKHWPDGHHSTVTIQLESPESGATILKLDQMDIPEEDKFGNSNVLEVTEEGWKNQIFHKIKSIFGYGI